MIPWCWSQWFCRNAGTRSAKRVLARCNKTQLPSIVPFVKSPYGVPHNWRQTSLWKSWWRRFRWKTQRETRVGASKWSHSTIRPNAFMSCRIGAASEVGVVELFFSNAVQLTIIPQWIFSFNCGQCDADLISSTTGHEWLNQDKNGTRRLLLIRL